MEAKQWLLLSFLFVFSSHAFTTLGATGSVKSATFRSPAFTLAPGEVQNVNFFDVNFVKGHIGMKQFDAELVDEDGKSVPLTELYLHHWLIFNYLKNSSANATTITVLGNDGLCTGTLPQLFGIGAESRHTPTHMPDPYAIEAGKYEEEAWILTVHAIDLRGTVDPHGCLECRCDHYNVTVDANGNALEDGYIGGLDCCYDGLHCQLKDGYVGKNHTYYLQYTVHYMDWEDSILPLKIYILDSTYDGTQCHVEYNVPSCSSKNIGTSKCVMTQESVMKVPIGGDVIYGVAHQHIGGIGSAIYGQDGREICTSIPLYGNGTEAGNEAGYVVGMTTCYPEPGSVQVSSGESVRTLSNYSESLSYVGVMGLGYIAVHPRAGV